MSTRHVLFRHFLRQLASFEAAATGGEAKYVIIAVVSLVAGPGYLAALVAARGSRTRAYTHSGIVPPELWLWKQEWLLLSVSLVAVAALVAIQWRSFVLGGRDFRILGLLPVPRRTVMSARLRSVVAVVLLLHVAINTLPGLWLPVASPFGYFRAAFALQAALLLQTVFACAAIVALQGFVVLALPPGASRRASLALQTGILLAVALLFVAEGSISRLAFAARDSAHPVNWIVPVGWFRALYVELLGVDSAELAGQARLALLATAAAVAGAVPCSLLGFRDAGAGEDGHRYGSGLASRPLVTRLAAGRGRPVVRAVSSFVGKALLRSPSAGFIARGLFVVGVALTVSGFAGIALRDFGYDAPVLPAQPLHAPAFVLPFFALVGLRLSAVYPSSLGANWIFRLTETPGSADYAAGIRRAALHTVVLPLLVLLAIPYAVSWGPVAAAAHLLLALAVALVTIEWLFLGFPKIPFTCSYQPGKANLRVTWPRHAAVFVLYCGIVPSLAARVEARPAPFVVSLCVLLVAWRWLVRLRERKAREGRLVF
ncbi:MAG TPA: hypothetical protein VLL75_04160, partial [Vicinamibacteria bacterium]|nr:hypothetical protein [Vicinamibacteria bacterium]